ncbi:Hypothetical predicted protein [Paramuricea clavata]|uniref:Uncharacterized protein n=1 Tax=Paramuricea clavata TaxID=317549 RepID=A0A6S7JZU9_PARCT|nr:Hypothetical predicted protein [Paramuricea clavata]
MKYFAIAVIFGLFAISQAMPVEEDSREKRFNPFLIGAFKLAQGACNGITNSGQPVDPLIGRACTCLNAAGNLGGILGIFGDESMTSEDKRFLFGGGFNLGAAIQQVMNIVKNVCASAPPDFADLCQCITG